MLCEKFEEGERETEFRIELADEMGYLPLQIPFAIRRL
jgi:hypothetical protein